MVLRCRKEAFLSFPKQPQKASTVVDYVDWPRRGEIVVGWGALTLSPQAGALTHDGAWANY